LLCAGLLWAFCPVAIAISSTVMAETLFTFFVVVALYLSLGRISLGTLSAQAACWSAATLTRPSGVLLPLVVACFLMVDELSWPGYARLWLLSPRQAERVRRIHQAVFEREAFSRSTSKWENLWETRDDPSSVRRLRAQADQQLQGRQLTIAGTHLIGAIQVLRPIPPWTQGGPLLTLLDAVRLLLVPIVMVVLVWRRQWWLLAFVCVWASYALLLPGVCGVWRFRCMAEPPLTLALAAALSPLLTRWPARQRRVRRPASIRCGVSAPHLPEEGQRGIAAQVRLGGE
jgi:hypothetical protein